MRLSRITLTMRPVTATLLFTTLCRAAADVLNYFHSFSLNLLTNIGVYGPT